MTKNQKSKPIPAFTHGSPNVPSIEVPISQDQPIYSAYTGKFIQYGPINFGSVICDAPFDHKRYGEYYHGIVVTKDGHYMAHQPNFFR